MKYTTIFPKGTKLFFFEQVRELYSLYCYHRTHNINTDTIEFQYEQLHKEYQTYW